MWQFLTQRGPGIAFWLFALAAQMSGYTSIAAALALTGVAVFFLIAPSYHAFHKWKLNREAAGRPMTTSQMLLLLSILGTWLFLTLGFTVAAWIIWSGKGVVIGSSTVRAGPDEGPMLWFKNLRMEGGPLTGRNVFSLTFRGTNSSQNEIELKSANIISAVNGAKIPLEVVAQNEIVALNDIQLVPPGAPVDLVAKFGPPDPNAPGKILGLDAKTFVETWRQFSLNIQDDVKSYRMTFNEGDLAAFFPGMIGPHVSKKK